MDPFDGIAFRLEGDGGWGQSISEYPNGEPDGGEQKHRVHISHHLAHGHMGGDIKPERGAPMGGMESKVWWE